MQSFNSIRKFCISLYSTPDRLNGFLESAKQFGLENYTIYFGLHKKMTPRLQTTAGVVLPAILLSMNHYSLWNFIAMEKGSDWYMILEDDAVFNVTPARMDELMERIPANAEFVSWGTSRPEGWRPKDLELVKFYPVKIFPCTHAYMIKPATARKLVAYFNELDICDTIDLLLVNHIYKKINVYLANYPIISQKSVLETLPLEKRTFTYPSLLI